MTKNDNPGLSVSSSALAWLTLLDDANYEACWQTAAEYFKNGVSLEEWTQKATSARSAVGELHLRELVKSVETEDVLGPVGKCYVCEYKSRFAKVGEIGERLTLHLEDDGQWRAVGYFVI